MSGPRLAQPVIELMSQLGLTDGREIGRGATSTVFVARQTHLSRDVAIKVFASPLVNERARRRFERECQALGMVSAHPNVVTLLSSGFDREERPWIMMEYCPGGSLYDLIGTTGPLPVAEVLRLGVKVSSALQLAHDNGLLHRDIKPANVLLTAWREPALADFGIAGDPSELSISVADALTPLYAAPEVLEHGGGSPASDVWSLASTLYALLLGHAPYAGTGEGLLSLLNRIVHEPLPPLQRDDVPQVVLEVLAQGITKDPAQRTPSARALAEGLQEAQRQMGLTVTDYPMMSIPGVESASSDAVPAAAHEDGSLTVGGGTVLSRRPRVVAPELAPRRRRVPTIPRPAALPLTRLRSARTIIPAAGAVLLVAAVAVVAVVLSSGSSTKAPGIVPAARAKPAPVDVAFTAACRGFTCTFTAADAPGGASYRWVPDDGQQLPTSAAVAHYDFGKPGQHQVRLDLVGAGNAVLGTSTQQLALTQGSRRLQLRHASATAHTIAVVVRASVPACLPGAVAVERHARHGWTHLRTVTLHDGRGRVTVRGTGVYRARVAAAAVVNGLCTAGMSPALTVAAPPHADPLTAPAPQPVTPAPPTSNGDSALPGGSSGDPVLPH